MSKDIIEIERSFIVNKPPDSSLINQSIYHEIGYLLTDPGELRVYKKNSLTGWKFGITIKSDGDRSRNEWEDKNIPKWAFDLIWPNTNLCRVEKTRHYIQFNNNNRIYHLELDEYFNNCLGLLRLECEFPSDEEADLFELPEWVKNSVEVTNDSRFKNKNLARLDRKSFLELINEFNL